VPGAAGSSSARDGEARRLANLFIAAVKTRYLVLVSVTS
jgi:hypothetical protein